MCWTGNHFEESKSGCDTRESPSVAFVAEVILHPCWISVTLGDSEEAEAFEGEIAEIMNTARRENNRWRFTVVPEDEGS